MSSLPHPNQRILVRLRWRWATVAVIWTTVWLLIYWQLRPIWPHANQWLLLSGLMLGYGLWVLWRGLPQNHRPSETTLLDTMYDLPSLDDVTKVVVDEAVITGDSAPYMIFGGSEPRQLAASD